MRNALRTERERGAVLYLALFVLIPMAALTFALVRIATSFSSEHRHRIEDEHTLFLAEAGVQEAMAALVAGGTGSVGSAAAPVYFGDGLLWVEAEQVANRLIMLHSAAMYEGGRAAVDQLVSWRYASNLDTVIFSRRALDIQSAVLIDSFDSTLGTYASQVSRRFAGDEAIVESNAGIRVGPAVDIHGDVHAGTGYGVSVANSAEVSGSLQPLDSERTIEDVAIPAIPVTGNRTMGGNSTLPAGDYAWGTLTINGNATIRGPARIVVDRLDQRSGSTLSFDTTGGPIQVYVKQQIIQASNSNIVTLNQSAKGLTLYYMAPAGSTADLRSNSQFYGRIVAPHATVSLRSNFELFGTVEADQVIVNSNVRIHFDRALLRGITEVPIYGKVAWSRAAFPVAAFAVNRSDPFRLVGIARQDLALPGDSHAMP